MIDDNNEHNLDVNAAKNASKTENQEFSESDDLKLDQIIDSKDNQITELKNQLSQVQNDNRNSILRLKAEIENIRRRHVQEIERTHKFALERFILELLPVIDNLERTLSITDSSKITLSSIIEGINLTLKSFLDTVFKFGVKSVHDVNIAFNPEIHQAISTIESEEHESNQVLSIIQKGYILNGRLIRPAMVTVSKSKTEVEE